MSISLKKIVFVLIITLFSNHVYASGATESQVAEFMLKLAKRTDLTFLFGTRYYKCETWDVKRSKPIPKSYEYWTVSGFKPAVDASNGKAIDWGKNGDRYVAVDIVLDQNNRPYHMIDDAVGSKNCLTFTLNLYEYDGKFVKVISKWGYLLGEGSQGIVYMQEGKYATFLSNVQVKKGGSLEYKVIGSGLMNHACNLIHEDEFAHCCRTGQMSDRVDNTSLQLSSNFPPKPTFDVKQTEILNKITKESAFLQAKYYQKDVFDAGRWDWPKSNKPWNFLTISVPLDITNIGLIDWGPNGDRYVQFEIEFEGKRNYSALTDDMYSTGKRFVFALRLYEKDGKFVKTVSNFGNFWGFGQGSFVYIQEVKNTNATFFTKLPVKFDEKFSYMVEKERAVKLSDVLNFKPAQ